jgi:hypothetical protein
LAKVQLVKVTLSKSALRQILCGNPSESFCETQEPGMVVADEADIQ